MRGYTLVTPLKAIRMLLSGESHLVRVDRWNAVPKLLCYTRHHDTCAASQTFGADCTCGLIDALMAVYGPDWWLPATPTGEAAAGEEAGQ